MVALALLLERSLLAKAHTTFRKQQPLQSVQVLRNALELLHSVLLVLCLQPRQVFLRPRLLPRLLWAAPSCVRRHLLLAA
jgi:hypothetical protein